MAANPVGRWCACGCGQSIDHLSKKCRLTPECAERRFHERKAEQNKRRRAPRKKKYIPSVDAGAKRLPRGPLEQEFVSQKKCPACADMPWARTKERRQSFQSVVNDNGECVGCGGKYAPEVIQQQFSGASSASALASAGALYGCSARVARTKADVGNGWGKFFYRKGVK